MALKSVLIYGLLQADSETISQEFTHIYKIQLRPWYHHN